MVEGDISAGNGEMVEGGPQQETGRWWRFLSRNFDLLKVVLTVRMGRAEGDSEVHMRFIHRWFDLRCPADLSCF